MSTTYNVLHDTIVCVSRSFLLTVNIVRLIIIINILIATHSASIKSTKGILTIIGFSNETLNINNNKTRVFSLRSSTTPVSRYFFWSFSALFQIGLFRGVSYQVNWLAIISQTEELEAVCLPVKRDISRSKVIGNSPGGLWLKRR